jgi:hypothetical protein
LPFLNLIIGARLGLIWEVSELADHLTTHAGLRSVHLGADLGLKEEGDDDCDNLVRWDYLDEEVDDHDDAAALLDSTFPRRQIIVVIAIDDDKVDEDEPDDVDDQGEKENHHHDILVVLRLTHDTLR